MIPGAPQIDRCIWDKPRNEELPLPMEEIQHGVADNSHNGILLSTRPHRLIIQDGSRALTARRLCDDRTWPC